MVNSQLADRPNNRVLWAQVWGLAAVQGAIALTWVIYNLYLVDLLSRMGFPAALATALLVVENLLAMGMEPLMGSLSDRLQAQLGTRFPLISLGVILAAGLFVAVPAIALGGTTAAFRWVLPGMLVAWALAMTTFRSPALSLLGRYAFGTRLPQAASILTLVGGVAGAMGPLANSMILGWGPLIAFTLGSGVLLVAAAVLRLAQPNASLTSASVEEHQPHQEQAISWPHLGLVFGAGVGITLGFRVLMALFSRVLDARASNVSPGIVLGSIFLALALTAIPAGGLAGRLGNRRAMGLGLAGMALVCVLIGGVPQRGGAIALALLFGATFSLVSNGTIPFALSLVPTAKAGLGTGMFFSGGAAASSLFGTFARQISQWPLALVSGLGILALLLAGISIFQASSDRTARSASTP